MHVNLRLGACHVQVPLCQQECGAEARSAADSSGRAGWHAAHAGERQSQAQGGRGEAGDPAGQVRRLGAQESRPGGQSQGVRGESYSSRKGTSFNLFLYEKIFVMKTASL